MRILDSGKMLFLYHIAFFQWLPAHFLWFTSYCFIRFIVSYHLLSCQFSALQQLKLFLQVKSFWQAEITSFSFFVFIYTFVSYLWFGTDGIPHLICISISSFVSALDILIYITLILTEWSEISVICLITVLQYLIPLPYLY